MNKKSYYVYILTNKHHTVYYTGVTNDLPRRIYEHRNKLVEGFTKKYNVTKLVYYEEYNEIQLALEREKQIKDYRREKKVALITAQNPKFNDLSQNF